MKITRNELLKHFNITFEQAKCMSIGDSQRLVDEWENTTIEGLQQQVARLLRGREASERHITSIENENERLKKQLEKLPEKLIESIKPYTTDLEKSFEEVSKRLDKVTGELKQARAELKKYEKKGTITLKGMKIEGYGLTVNGSQPVVDVTIFPSKSLKPVRNHGRTKSMLESLECRSMLARVFPDAKNKASGRIEGTRTHYDSVADRVRLRDYKLGLSTTGGTPKKLRIEGKDVLFQHLMITESDRYLVIEMPLHSCYEMLKKANYSVTWTGVSPENEQIARMFCHYLNLHHRDLNITKDTVGISDVSDIFAEPGPYVLPDK